MRKRRTTRKAGSAKLALILLGLTLGLGAVAYAIAETVREPRSANQGKRAAAAGRGLSILVSPRSRSVSPGQATSFSLVVRGGAGPSPRLRVANPPKALRTWFTPRPRGMLTTLRVDTAGASNGAYPIRLFARRGRRWATTVVNLVIAAPSAEPPGATGSSFSISGDLQGPLAPGSSEPIDLVLANPGSSEIAISELVVSIQSISAPQSDQAHPCTPDDFAVTQFSGAYGFRIPPSGSRSLSELGFPSQQWPQVTMLDRPVNQNGCKGASLTFGYTGTSSEATS
jgi:hypothetical protein